jgi:hypothetical protein
MSWIFSLEGRRLLRNIHNANFNLQFECFPNSKIKIFGHQNPGMDPNPDSSQCLSPHPDFTNREGILICFNTGWQLYTVYSTVLEYHEFTELK